LRRITREHGALLVFDEAATGFRVAYGGAQTLLGVEPDLTCLGRVIGGGLPLAAWGGRRRLLERAAAIGAGTGGQVPGTGGRTGGAGTHGAGTRGARALPEMAPAMAAGIAVLDALREGGTYARLETLGSRLGDGLRTAAVAASVPCAVNRVGSMLTVFPGVERVDDAEGAGRCDLRGFTRLHRTWSDAGVIWPDSPFEAAFLSTAHQVADVDRAVSAFAGALRTRNAEPA
jgi:glutamate-1-semialdehyde 2,1-aminomutase